MIDSIFPVMSLADAGVELHDCEHKTPPRREQGHPYIAIPNVRDGRLDLTDVRLINDDELAEWNRRTTPRAGDIVLTRRGRVGDSAVIPDGLSCAIGQNLVILRSDGTKIDQRFLRWLMRGPLHRAQVARFLNMGAVFDSLNCSDIPRFEVPVPAIEEQRAIADVLGALDDKIECNRRSMATLELLFLTECMYAVERAQPEETVALGDIANVWLGGTPSKAHEEYWKGGNIPWINSGCLHQRPVLDAADFITEAGLRSSATKVAPAGSTVLAITGATLGVVSRLSRPVAFNQSVVAVHSPDDARLDAYLYFWLRTNIHRLVESATGAAQQHVNRGNVCELTVPRPSDALLEEVGESASLLAAQDLLARQSRTLASLRDALLPELLSGRRRVRSADDFVTSEI